MGFFDFLRKKPVENSSKFRKNTIKYEKRTFDVGKTVVELTFEDGRKFKTTVVGEFSQYVNPGCDYFALFNVPHQATEPSISKASIQTSLAKAKYFLTNLSLDKSTFVDDPTDVRKSIIGKIAFAKILESKEFKLECEVAFIVPKEEAGK